MCNSTSLEQTTFHEILRPPTLLQFFSKDWPLSSRSQERNNLNYFIFTHHCKYHFLVEMPLSLLRPASLITSVPHRSFSVKNRFNTRMDRQTQVVLQPGKAAFPSTALHSGQHLLQVFYLQLPHPSVKRRKFGEVCHLHCMDDWLRRGGLDDAHHHDIFACKNSSWWSIVKWQLIEIITKKSSDDGETWPFFQIKIFLWGSIILKAALWFLVLVVIDFNVNTPRMIQLLEDKTVVWS